MSYFQKENSIKIGSILSRAHSLHPSEFRSIKMNNTTKKTLKSLVDFENVGTQIDTENYTTKKTGFHLINISCMNGLLLNEKKGENISQVIYNGSDRKLSKGDVIISRNATLGKVSYVYKDINGILNGGLSYFKFKDKYKYYLMAFFINNYGKQALENACSGGGTQKNAKRSDLLNLEIPFPSPTVNTDVDLIIQFIGKLVQDIIYKESLILSKTQKIDELIENELFGNQKKNTFQYEFPKITEIFTRKRLDTSTYSFDTKKIAFIIKNYNLGYSTLSKDLVSGGNTPKKRIFGKSENYWFTPTTLDRGVLVEKEFIKTPSYNLVDNDYILISNRSNVGESLLFNVSDYKVGHHNQGMYKVKINNKGEDLFLLCWFNSSIFQKYVNAIASGATFPEIRTDNFPTDFFIPNFDATKKSLISLEYFNESLIDNEKGIYQLNRDIFKIKDTLNNLIYSILMDIKIN